MRAIASVVLISFLWTTTFAPAALAVENPRQQMNNRFGILVERLQSEGWRIENPEHRALKTTDFLTGQVKDFTMLPPAENATSDYRFQVRIFSPQAALVKYAVVVRDAQDRVLSRRVMQIDPKEDPAAVRVRMEQMATSISNDLTTQASNGIWQRVLNWICPSAYAATASPFIQGLATVGMMALAAGVVVTFVALIADNERVESEGELLVAGGLLVFLGIYLTQR